MPYVSFGMYASRSVIILVLRIIFVAVGVTVSYLSLAAACGLKFLLEDMTE